jgi:EAL domain-containing protein (putative c-di-GMP-specific phosphodiesterase class I)
VAEPIVTKSAPLVCDFSLGVVTTAPARTQSRWSSESIVRAAEMALYEAKSDEKGNLTFYDAELEQRHVARRALIDAIPLALENDEFFVAFQPKVDLLSRETYGFEALIRWARDGSIVPPDEFIPFAEENNLIIDLDLFVMRTAVSQLVAWNDLRDKPLCVSVNLSGLHFSNDSIVQEVKNVLAETGLAPHLLTLEITETILLDDWSNMQILLKALRELGVLISLDDFGTGYSSLAYLRRISADELKIDRSFVTELEQSQEARFILDAVVDIANGLGMTIVVEGIETAAQSQIVQSFGCTNGQGYLFGAPKDADRTVTDILNVPVSLPSQKSA